MLAAVARHEPARGEVIELCDGKVEDARPLIESGVYRASCQSYKTGLYFKGQPRAILTFRIQDPGPAYGVEVIRAYRLKSLKGSRFTVARGSDLLYEYSRALDLRVRPDRISLRALLPYLWRIRVRTVKLDCGGHDRRPRELPDHLQYSVVAELLGRGE